MPRDGDTGSGTVLAVGVLGAVTALALATVAVSSVLVDRAAVAGAADSGALAAADVAAGFAAGSPCSAAEEVVVAAGAALTGCDVTGTTAVVEAKREALMGIRVTARARAGQPPARASG